LPLVAATLALPLCAQQHISVPAPISAESADVPQGSPDKKADAMTPAELADIAARGIQATNLFTEKYTYTETEHIQNFIDGQLQVDHTTVYENIFIHNLPYMRKTAVDGKPLDGKDLKHETALYDDAVKKRTSLDLATRANLERHALRTTSHTDLDKLAANFKLAVLGHEDVDGHDCVILDATPKSENIVPANARHIRMDIENSSQIVLQIRIEFLADDSGFAKGSVLETHYALVAGVPLASHQTWDTTVRFAELMNKAIRIHRDITYTNYRRFHATVVIKMVGESNVDTSTPEPPAAAKPAKPTETSFDKEEDKRLAREAKANAKAREKAEKKARDDAKKTPPPPPMPTYTPPPAGR
jgi:hypothetical protein